MPKPPPQTVYRLKISLKDVEPLVWRTLLVPGSIRLARLHEMFQVAMGWTNSHLHSFTIADRRYGMQFDEYPEGEIDEKSVTVISALSNCNKFVYEYDFGDGWEHDVVVEEVARTPIGLKFAVCLNGANACPPEDSGGPWGYKTMLEALSNPNHEDHEQYASWLNKPFDATTFDIATTNAALQR